VKKAEHGVEKGFKGAEHAAGKGIKKGEHEVKKGEHKAEEALKHAPKPHHPRDVDVEANEFAKLPKIDLPKPPSKSM
jgi:hypothetical protein